MTTSGKIRVQPPRLITQTITDRSMRRNFDQIDSSLQDVQSQLNGRNYQLSTPIQATKAATGKVVGLSGSILASGKPLIVALVASQWKRAVQTSPGVFTAGGNSGVKLSVATGTPSSITAVLGLYRDGVKAFTADVGSIFSAGASTLEHRLPPFFLLAFDPQPAGQHKYEVSVEVLAANVQVIFSAVQLLLLEW